MFKKSLLYALLPFGLMAADATMTGWISDSECTTSNAGGSKDQRACVKRCLDSGSTVVFISDGEQKVYKLAGAPEAKDHLKTKVKITGSVNGDTVKVAKLEDVN